MANSFKQIVFLSTICLIIFFSCKDDSMPPLNPEIDNERFKLSTIMNYGGEEQILKFIDELEYSKDKLVKIISIGEIPNAIENDSSTWIYEIKYFGDTLNIVSQRNFSTFLTDSKYIFNDGYLIESYVKQGNWASRTLYFYDNQKLMFSTIAIHDLMDSDSFLSDSSVFYYDISGVNISKVESYQKSNRASPNWIKTQTFNYTYDNSIESPIYNFTTLFALGYGGYGIGSVWSFTKNLCVESRLINHYNNNQEIYFFEYKYKFSDSNQIIEIEEYENSILIATKVLEYENCD